MDLFGLQGVPERIKATVDQIMVLDQLALLDGRPVGEVVLSRVPLRNAIKAGLVEVSYAPTAVYRLTGVGRMVRSRPRGGAHA